MWKPQILFTFWSFAGAFVIEMPIGAFRPTSECSSNSFACLPSGLMLTAETLFSAASTYNLEHRLLYTATRKLTPLSRVLHKLIVAHLVKKFLAINSTLTFITVLTTASHQTSSWPWGIQLAPLHRFSFEIHLNIVLPSRPLFRLVSATKILLSIYYVSYATGPAHLTVLHFIPLIITGESTDNETAQNTVCSAPCS